MPISSRTTRKATRREFLSEPKGEKSESEKKLPLKKQREDKGAEATFCLLKWWMEPVWHLPDSLLNSSSISSFPLDLGILPINRRVLGSLTFTFKSFPSPRSYKSSCGERKKHKENNCGGHSTLQAHIQNKGFSSKFRPQA